MESEEKEIAIPVDRVGAPAVGVPPRLGLLRLLLIAVSVGGVSLLGPDPASWGVRWCLWAVGSVAWLTGLASAQRIPTLWLVLGAILLRGLVLAGDPELSDDAYRYVWEGGLVAEGVSPFAVAPDSPELAVYQRRWSSIYDGVNHREVSAAYPPLTQWVHAGVTTLAGGPGEPGRALFAMRLFYGAMDLLCLLPLAILLRGSRRTGASLFAWAWSPLVAVEFAGGAHFDSFGVLLLLSALAVARSALNTGTGRQTLVLGLLVAGALVKLLPGLVIPFCARGKRRWLALPICAAVFALAWMPFISGGGAELLAGLSEYGTRWEAGSLVYRWIERPLGSWFERDGGLTDPRRIARAMIGLAFLAIFFREWRRELDLVRTVGVLIGSFLVLSPTLHPWYLTWVVPFVALRPSRAWSLLLAMAPLLYWPLAKWKAEGVWIEPDWLWPVLAPPFFALWALDARRTRSLD